MPTLTDASFGTVASALIPALGLLVLAGLIVAGMAVVLAGGRRR